MYFLLFWNHFISLIVLHRPNITKVYAIQSIVAYYMSQTKFLWQKRFFTNLVFSQESKNNFLTTWFFFILKTIFNKQLDIFFWKYCEKVSAAIYIAHHNLYGLILWFTPSGAEFHRLLPYTIFFYKNALIRTSRLKWAKS